MVKMIGSDVIEEEAFLMDFMVGHMNTEASPPNRTHLYYTPCSEKSFSKPLLFINFL